MYRFAYWLCGDQAQADDITAETFARALTAYDALRAVTVKGYLFTIARNIYREEQRRGKRFATLDAGLVEQGPPLEEQAADRVELAALFTKLQEFDETERAALLMRAQAISYDEIAATLKISLAAAKVKVHRIRKKLLAWRLTRAGTG